MTKTLKHLNCNQALYHAGDAIEGLWRITTGVLILRQYTSEGKAQIIDILGPGEYVDMKLRGMRTHEAVAVAPAEVQQLAYASLNADEREEFLELALQRLGFLEEHSVILGREYAEQRVRAALAYLSQKSGPHPAVDYGLSRQHMADFCGLTLETVSRIFSNWKKQGLNPLAMAETCKAAVLN